jgi:hypothetical protein
LPSGGPAQLLVGQQLNGRRSGIADLKRRSPNHETLELDRPPLEPELDVRGSAGLEDYLSSKGSGVPDQLSLHGDQPRHESVDGESTIPVSEDLGAGVDHSDDGTLKRAHVGAIKDPAP